MQAGQEWKAKHSIGGGYDNKVNERRVPKVEAFDGLIPGDSANEVRCGVGDDRGEDSEGGEIERTLEEDAEPTKLKHVARRAVEPVAHAKARLQSKRRCQ